MKKMSWWQKQRLAFLMVFGITIVFSVVVLAFSAGHTIGEWSPKAKADAQIALQKADLESQAAKQRIQEDAAVAEATRQARIDGEVFRTQLLNLGFLLLIGIFLLLVFVGVVVIVWRLLTRVTTHGVVTIVERPGQQPVIVWQQAPGLTVPAGARVELTDAQAEHFAQAGSRALVAQAQMEGRLLDDPGRRGFPVKAWIEN